MSVRATACLTAAVLAAAPLAAQQPGRVTYPETRATAHADTLHGVVVPDPFRWLENTDSPETKAWVQAENAVTFAYLDGIAARPRIKARLTELWDYPKYGVPFARKGTYFMFENSGLQNQSVLYAQRGLSGEPRVLLDPNAFSSDGTVALSALSPSHDAKYLGYGVSASGSDWQELRVRDVQSGEDLPDTLQWVKFSGMAWTADNKGFFYSRYDAPAEGNALLTVNKHQKLYYHRLGTPQSADELIYERPDEPDWGFGAQVSDDGQFAVISVSQGTDERNRLYFIDLGNPRSPRVTNPVVRLMDDFDASYTFIENAGPIFFLRTDQGAPRGRVIAVDINQKRRADWRTIVPEGKDALVDVSLIGERLVATYLHDAHSVVRMFSTGGAPLGEVTLPGLGSVSGPSGQPGDREMFYGFTSFLQPTTIYRYDLKDGQQAVFRQPELKFDASRYETRQVFYTSKDGTKIPMFITARKGLPLDGHNPTLLYGYGGFNISLTPSFSPSRLVWLEMGGVYAVPNLRGGGEYGQEWHAAGMKANKQNVFDDMIAAAEYLVREKYTSPEKLAVQGGSNGGLLVGAVMTQRPDLFGVALPAVGVMDMLRFHKFTIGWAWTSDYGTPDDSADFEVLRRYSPLQNLRPGTAYPATLVTTADHDDRVVPGHSFKFAATLQRDQAGPAPVLIRIESKAGHGGGKPTSKQIEVAADELAFAVQNLGMSGAAIP